MRWLRQFIIFLGAPSAWAVQVLFSTMLSSYACYPKTAPLSAPLWSWLQPALGFISVVCCAGAIFCAVTAWRYWSQTAHDKSAHFLALLAFMTSGLFVIAIVFTACALLLVASCSA